MKFDQRCTIPVSRAELWLFLSNLPAVAACVPGYEEITDLGNEQYSGRLRVKIGPIQLRLAGTMTVMERDAENFRIVAKVQAKEQRVGGGIDVLADMLLTELTQDATEIVIQAETRILGKLGEFGESLIRKQTDTVIATFAKNVTTQFQNSDPGLEPHPEPR